MYVSNQSNQDVYFDNMAVSIAQGNIIEENHYYSFGLKIAAISSKKIADSYGDIKNNYFYNDKELFDDADLNWYDYGFRNYDPQIGRFTQLDPLTDDYPYLTPYQYASNDPITNIDIDGLEGGSAVKAATEVGRTSATVLENITVTAVRRTTQTISNANRIWGGVKALGGVLEMVAGAIGGIATSWTGIGGVVGGAAVLHGADVTSSGFMQLWTGKETSTLTEQGVSKGLQLTGLSKNNSSIVASYIDGGISLVFTAGAGAARDATFLRVPRPVKAAKGGTQLIEQAAVHGNSLKSLKPTWGYKLYSQDGTFLKNGITSKLVPESRYTKAFMSDKYMVPFKQFPKRLEAYQWEFGQNQIMRGPLNLNMH